MEITSIFIMKPDFLKAIISFAEKLKIADEMKSR